MRPVELAYGPPGSIGVKHLQYLSADEPDYRAGCLHSLPKWIGIAAAATWGYAEITHQPVLAKNAQTVAIVSVVIELLSRSR